MRKPSDVLWAWRIEYLAREKGEIDIDYAIALRIQAAKQNLKEARRSLANVKKPEAARG